MTTPKVRQADIIGSTFTTGTASQTGKEGERALNTTNGLVYICKDINVFTNVDGSILNARGGLKWVAVAGAGIIFDWIPNKGLPKNMLANYNGILYRSLVDHNASNDIATDVADGKIEAIITGGTTSTGYITATYDRYADTTETVVNPDVKLDGTDANFTVTPTIPTTAKGIAQVLLNGGWDITYKCTYDGDTQTLTVPDETFYSDDYLVILYS